MMKPPKPTDSVTKKLSTQFLIRGFARAPGLVFRAYNGITMYNYAAGREKMTG